MITGFNTDIEYQGVTYHVQTEDKGMKTPLILSLVYDRGTILASKRSPYNDLLEGHFDENELMERLQKQHKLICAAIRAGRIEDLKRMTMKESAAKQAGLIAQKEIKVSPKEEIGPPASVEKTAAKRNTEEVPLPQVLKNDPQPDTSQQFVPDAKESAKSSAEEDIWELPLSILEESPIFDEVQIVEEEEILPAEAVEIVVDAGKTEASDDSLKIEMLDNIVFKSGERKALAVIVKRGNSETGLDGAHVMVKVIGSSFRPLIFHAKTDSNGVAVVHLQLPHFRAGRAAVLVKAMSGGEEVEIRRAIQHS